MAINLLTLLIIFMKSNTKTICLLFIISLLIKDVIGDEDERVSVNDGGSVTLHTDLTDLKRVDVITWWFNGERIARINRGVSETPVYDSDKRFTDRLKMNPQTGDLTITHITSELTGDYKLEIINGETITKTFSINVKEKLIEDVKDDGSSKGLASGVIAGIWVLVLVLVIVAVAAVVVIFRRHKKKPQDFKTEMETHEPLRNVDNINVDVPPDQLDH